MLSTEVTPRKGIAPQLLIEQVRNTAPFLWNREFQAGLDPIRHRHLLEIATLPQERLNEPLEAWSDPDYFRLCLLAHHSSVATFVPTDVDIAIRFKLWLPHLHTSTLETMAQTVIESKDWDYLPVTRRFVCEPGDTRPIPGRTLSGHHGEWFSTAAAAYGALKLRSPDLAAQIAGLIVEEYHRENALFERWVAQRNGIEILKTATTIAHNLGDLDRVLEQWHVHRGDPLGDAVFNGGEKEHRVAATLNKTFMAPENHRHFALRKPRCLRRAADLMIPIGPFFDEWGMKLARHPELSPADVGEIVEALVQGVEKLPGKTFAYSRALAGILENFPGGMSALSKELTAKTAREIKAGPLRQSLSISRQRFEFQWNQFGLSARK